MATAKEYIRQELDDYKDFITSSPEILSELKRVFSNAVQGIRPRTGDKNIAYGDDDFRWNRFFIHALCVVLDTTGEVKLHIHTGEKVPDHIAETICDATGVDIAMVPGTKSCAASRDDFYS